MTHPLRPVPAAAAGTAPQKPVSHRKKPMPTAPPRIGPGGARSFRTTLRTGFDVNVRHCLLSPDTLLSAFEIIRRRDWLIASSSVLNLFQPLVNTTSTRH